MKYNTTLKWAMKVAKTEFEYHPDSPNARIMARLRSEILRQRAEKRRHGRYAKLVYGLNRD